MFNPIALSSRLALAGFFFLSIPIPALAAGTFAYDFSVNGTLNEVGALTESTSPYWWVNSGGFLTLTGGVSQTNQGALSATNVWRLAYLAANPTDTDNGYHPQNLFRLVTKGTWRSASVVSDFYIVRDNWSDSSNRNASNGLLLMNRYADDGQTLYYAGVRVDGNAVIKKKYRGTYYTMAQKKVFPGTYEAGEQSNLIPHSEWLSLKSDTVTKANGSVRIDLYMKRAGDTSWTLLVSGIDDGAKYGGTPVIADGHAGIRTDFMDMKFDRFRVYPL
ncbi:MAG: hypothetical protein AAB582_01880 [Patescibacteria group bacterium]